MSDDSLPSPSSSTSSLSKQTEPIRAAAASSNNKLVSAEHVQKKVRRALTGNENTSLRDHARQNLQRTSVVVKKQVRRALTGSSDRRLRDWAKEAKVVKTVDKFSFCVGVTVLLATEFVFLQYPNNFGHYYVVLVSCMMALRLYMYARNKWLYFLIDFCYMCNASCFLSVLVFPENTVLWRLNYAVTNGTLLGAILAWRNSFVFHSLDKVTSIAIHLLPGLLTFLERWKTDSKMCLEKDCTLGIQGALLEPLAFYMFWQLLYILKTEVRDRHVMKANPDIQTSLRWLTRDSKNAMHQIAKRTCRAIGFFGPNEEFDPESLKTKCVFWVFNLLFVVVTLLPSPILFHYHKVNTAYILFVLAAAIYNGSNYYFEVFAARYMQKLEEKQRDIIQAVEQTAANGAGAAPAAVVVEFVDEQEQEASIGNEVDTVVTERVAIKQD